MTGVMARTTWYKSVNLFDMLKANIGNLSDVIDRSNPLNHSLRDFPRYQTLDEFKADLDFCRRKRQGSRIRRRDCSAQR